MNYSCRQFNAEERAMTITDPARDRLKTLLTEHPDARLRVLVAGYG